ncbi:MAG TPA: Gfo/Idh/MocA family oxidoreductase [Planctomycetota bacterium]|nr:Gfo/Idh/MocA family oxidoreductase [Planctomycetota bacterium]
MPQTLRMGYVGCGFMAQKVHIPNILSLDGVELTAIAELRPKLGAKVQERFRIPKLYASHAELAKDPDIEAVGVSGHFYAQGEIAIDLLLAGKDVFMEKPMAVSVEQAERILDAERRSGKRLMVAYMKRYDAGNVLVKKLVDDARKSGEMGKLRFVRNHGFCGDWTAGLDTPMDKTDEPYPAVQPRYPAWLPDEHVNGYLGYLQQYTHNVNLVRWLLDAGGDVKVKAVELDRERGYFGVVVLEVGGVQTVIESGAVAYHGWEEHTQLYFEGGWIKTEAPPLLLRNVPATVEVYRGNTPAKSTTHTFPEGGREWAYKAEMRHFVECVRSGAPFRSPASDTLEDVRTFEAIYRRHIEALAP